MRQLTLLKSLAYCILSCYTFLVHADSGINEIESSVIKIYATLANPDYIAPWQLKDPLQVSGSGAVISKQRILTNAHVVANAKYIQVQKHQDPNKYIAEVSFISHEADLALLKLDLQVFKFRKTARKQVS